MLLKNKLCSILFLVLLAVISDANEQCEATPSIIIIGAGASGIAAASKLFENGFKNVKILEVQDRIGGRINTTKFNNYSVELGAQWVHGEKNNVGFELAWPLNLLERGNMSKRKLRIVDSNGNMMDETMIKELFHFDAKSEDSIMDYISNFGKSSTDNFFTNMFAEYMDALSELKEYKNGIFNFLDLLFSSTYSAESLRNVSISAPIEFHASPGEFFINWKDRGYSTLLDILMKRFPNPEEELPVVKNTVFNTEVSSIDYSNKNGKVTIKTTDCATYTADHVIFTCSLGVLKNKHESLFKPSLPEKMQNTIEALGFGNVGKIFLSFDEQWWPDDASGVMFSIIWKDTDLEMIKNDPEKRWLQGIVKVFSVENRPRLLAAWVPGKYSREVEKLSDEKVLEHINEFLQRFLGKTYKVTAPSGMRRSKWSSNEHFRGTYSYRSKQAGLKHLFHATLGEPVGDNKVLFAGEATSPHHFSSVHGAIETGWREANRIIKIYGKN